MQPVHAVVTAGATAVFDINNQRRDLLDTQGAGPRCVVTSDDQRLILGRDDALYFYDADGRGPTLALKGEKRQVLAFKGHLVLIGASGSGSGPTSQIQVRRAATRASL